MRLLRTTVALVTAGMWIGCALDFAIGPPGAVAPSDAATAAPDGNPVDAGADHYGERVTHDLVALWDFEEGAGAVLHDRVTTLAPVLDLSLDDPALAGWDTPHAITFRDRTWAVSGNPATKVVDPSRKTNAVTVEAWFAPALGVDSEYGRVVVAAGSASIATASKQQRGFALGVSLPTRSASVTTSGDAGAEVDAATYSTSMTAGTNQVLHGGAPTASLTHLVAVRSDDARLTLYVDAVNVGVLVGTAGPADWLDTYALIVGNLGGGGAGFLGDIHLVAIYRVALTADEVKTNFLAGADPR